MDKLKARGLHLVELPHIVISTPYQLEYFERPLEDAYKHVEQKARDATYNERKELFILLVLSHVSIRWLPEWLQPVARIVLRYKIGALYDIIVARLRK